jgi:hypothetical protein
MVRRQPGAQRGGDGGEQSAGEHMLIDARRDAPETATRDTLDSGGLSLHL